MPKNIVICADGTGNTTIKGRGTNVFKLYEAVDENGHRFDPRLIQQVAMYHDGVGTERLKWIRMFAGATGWGLSRNVKQLYAELARIYDPGDRIFLFGFSRGAFTVRTLAGLITTAGILDISRYPTNAAFGAAIRAAYREYRRKYQTALSRVLFGKVAVDAADLRRQFSVGIPGFVDPHQPVVDFVGVWDTVDAVGLPLRIADVINNTVYRFKFPDLRLSPLVGHACHALALDEARASFAPVLWQEDTPADHARIEQVWFAGVHSNVGGGYPRQGMSLVSLDWMMTRAEGHGLRFLAPARQQYRDRADGDDKLYDSRSGLGVFYRWKPRDAAALCEARGVEAKVHRTVFERIARNTEGYAPGSVPPDPRVVSMSALPPVPEAIRRVVAEAHAGGGPLVARHPGLLRVGRTAYLLLILSTTAFAALMLRMFWSDARAHGDWKEVLAAVLRTVASTNWFAIAGRVAWHDPWLPGIAALALLVGLNIDRRLDAAYSQFWHTVRVRLRAILQT